METPSKNPEIKKSQIQSTPKQFTHAPLISKPLFPVGNDSDSESDVALKKEITDLQQLALDDKRGTSLDPNFPFAIYWHPDCEKHEITNHPEQPKRASSILSNLRSVFPDEIFKEARKPEHLEKFKLCCHKVEEYYESNRQEAKLSIDGDTAVMRFTRNAAYRAAGSVVNAIDDIFNPQGPSSTSSSSSQICSAFCCVRPPGHHAERDKMCGFCFLGNAGIGALYALQKYGSEREREMEGEERKLKLPIDEEAKGAESEGGEKIEEGKEDVNSKEENEPPQRKEEEGKENGVERNIHEIEKDIDILVDDGTEKKKIDENQGKEEALGERVGVEETDFSHVESFSISSSLTSTSSSSETEQKIKEFSSLPPSPLPPTPLSSSAFSPSFIPYSQRIVKKVAVLDFDVHHGNGTEDGFLPHPNCFYGSTHELGAFPYNTGKDPSPFTGSRSRDPLHRRIVNRYIHAGEQSRGMFQLAWKEILEEMILFSPDLVIISAGFDAHDSDPLAGCNLIDSDFEWVTKEIMKSCLEINLHSPPPIVSVLEGGYHLEAITRVSELHVRELMKGRDVYQFYHQQHELSYQKRGRNQEESDSVVRGGSQGLETNQPNSIQQLIKSFITGK